MTRIAIVTGASSGLGAEIVRQLAEGAFGPLDQIWAVSRHARQTSPLVRPFALDLTDPASFDALEDALREIGVERMEALGKPFDLNEHDAVMTAPTTEPERMWVKCQIRVPAPRLT